MKFNLNLKKIRSRVLGAIPRGLPLETMFGSWQALLNNTLKTEISLVVEKLFKFNILLVLGPRGVPNRSP